MSSYSPLQGNKAAAEDPHDGIPRIDLNLWDHKISIAIHWMILFISSGVLPIVLYFALRYGANLALGTVLAVTTAIFGVVTLFSISKRFYQLLRPKSTCRPLGASRASLDYFQWNFLCGFICITAIVVAGNITKDIRIVTIGLPVLITEVAAQILIAAIGHVARMPAPFRMSSVPKGEPIRSGVYAVAEDIVAVDGGQGQMYRRQLQSRYLCSGVIQQLCLRLDFLFGVSGVIVGGIALWLIFWLENANVAYIMGWVIPWGYAAIMALITIRMVSSALKQENRLERMTNA